MDEFSEEAGLSDEALSADVRAFLARAQRSHQVPDPAVKQRVRAAVGVALIAAPLGAAPAALHELGVATKLAARWSLGAKLGAAVVAATLVGTAGWLLPSSHDASRERPARVAGVAPAATAEVERGSTLRSRAEQARAEAERDPGVAPPAPRADEARASTLTAQPATTASLATGSAPRSDQPGAVAVAPEPGFVARAPEGAGRQGAEEPHDSTNGRAADVLAVVDRSELSLLMAASDALDGRDAARGLSLLEQHRKRFPDSALEQERRGLTLVARCLREGAHDARLGREASAFLHRFPGAVLTTRIRRACGL